MTVIDLGPEVLPPAVRPSPLLRRAAAPVARIGVVVGLHLLAVGHDWPGGGFVAGLVLGACLALYRLGTGVMPPARLLRSPLHLLGLGVLVVATTVLVPAVLGGPVADMSSATVDLAALGSFKATSALVFDIGVLLIVVGLVAAVLEVGTQEEGS